MMLRQKMEEGHLEHPGGAPGENRRYRRVLLVNPPMRPVGAEFMMEDVPIRLEYIAEYIRPHVSFVEIVDMTRDDRDLEFFLEKYQPDMVGFTANYISVHQNVLDLSLKAKRFGARVVAGGYQATACAQEFAAHEGIDVVVRGEGEQTMLELVENRPIDEILGITYESDGLVVENENRPLIQDLESIPPPDRTRRRSPYNLSFTDLEADSDTAYDMIITSRGCWGKCKFCTEPMMSSGTQRYRKPESVVAELGDIVRLHPGKRLRILIADPNFGGDMEIAESVLDHIIEFRRSCSSDLHFFISVRTETVANNPEFVRKMALAGIDYVFVGMESPRKEDLIALKKGGRGKINQEKAVQELRKNNIAAMSCFLIGIPGQTEEDILSLVDYAKSLDLADCYFAVMTSLPGSELYKDAEADGRLLQTDFTKYRLYKTQMAHDILSPAKIRELCIRCNTKWYNDLMLMQEHKRWKNNGKRKRLHVFAKRFKILLDFLTFISEDADTEFDELDMAMFIRDLPNSELGDFTRRNPINEYLDMDRFLKILGNQKIQISVHTTDRKPISWVIKTDSGNVSYVDAINGQTTNPSIAINIDMGENALNPRTILAGIFNDNKDLRSKANLFRLAAAVSTETMTAAYDTITSSMKSRVHGFYSKLN